MQLNASNMIHKVTIKRKGASTQGSNGNWTEASPSTLYSGWASMTNLYGQEYW